MPYFCLFNRVTECICALEQLLGNPQIPLDVLRTIGMQVDALKQAQIDTEELYINQPHE